MINPTERSCWTACTSCHRCWDKGRYGAKCEGCSGRHDPKLRIYPDPDDFCDCRNGILRWKTQKGQRIVAKFDPSNGNIIAEPKSRDEEDWESFLKEEREKRNDETWDPIEVTVD